MPRLRSIVVGTIFAAAAIGGYSLLNQAYVEGVRQDEADARAAKKEIQELLPHIIALRTHFETTTDDSRYLWRDANRAIEDAQYILRTPLRGNPERECDILFRLNEINILTGHQHRFDAESYKTLNMCRHYVADFHGIPAQKP